MTIKKNITDIKNEAKKFREQGNFKMMEERFREYMELLIFGMIVSNYGFYGQFVIHLQRQYDCTFPAVAGVCIKKGIVYITFNPILALNCNNNEMRAILVHEVLHLLHLHIQREADMNLAKDSLVASEVNIAMDVAINQHIDHLPQWTWSLEHFVKMYSPKDYNNTTSYYNRYGNVKDKETFEYYLSIINKSQKHKDDRENYEKRKEALQKLSEMLNERLKNGEGISEDEIDGILKDALDASHYQWGDSDEADKQDLKSIIKQIAESAGKKAGTVPGEAQSLIDKLYKKPIVKWEDELKHMKGTIRTPYQLTILRRQRRQPERYDLKGRISDKKVNIVVAIDTSGSVSDKELEYIFTEIFSILNTSKFTLTIIECDADIARVYEAKNLKEIKMDVKGRGGTYFTPVFKYIKEEMKSKIDLLVYFTDGFGERHIDEAYKPRGYQVMWVLTGKDTENLSVDNPFTKRIKPLKVTNY